MRDNTILLYIYNYPWFFLYYISLILILIYIFVSPFIDNNIPQCFLDGAPNRKAPGVNCIMKENIESVLQLLRRLQPILTKKTISKVCENSDEKPYLTDADIVEMFTSDKVVGWEINYEINYWN